MTFVEFEFKLYPFAALFGDDDQQFALLVTLFIAPDATFRLPTAGEVTASVKHTDGHLGG